LTLSEKGLRGPAENALRKAIQLQRRMLSDVNDRQVRVRIAVTGLELDGLAEGILGWAAQAFSLSVKPSRF